MTVLEQLQKISDILEKMSPEEIAALYERFLKENKPTGQYAHLEHILLAKGRSKNESEGT